MQEEAQTQIKESDGNIKDYLLRSKSLKHITSVYTNEENTSKFSMGFILDVTDTHLLLGMITPYGRYDGFSVKGLETVYRLEHGGNYHAKLFKLYTEYNQMHNEVCTSEGPIRGLINHAKQNNLIITIELFESGLDDAQGFVESVDNGFLTMRIVDENGRKDGESIFEISSISYISCDSENEAMIKKLYEI